MFYQEQALERSHCRTNNTHLREGKQATISSLGPYRKGIKYIFYEKQTSNYDLGFFSRCFSFLLLALLLQIYLTQVIWNTILTGPFSQ